MHQHQRILLLVAAGVLMSTMDSSMVNVALPTLMEEYGSSLAITEWVVLIYLLTITVMLLFWGNLSGHIGPGRVYSTGVIVFSIGSLLCSLAPTIYSLIFFRFIQAMGASMMMAIGPALIKTAFPPDRLGQGLGMVGIATSMGLMTGPAVSGILIRWSHWRAIFWITVPIGLAVYLLGKKPLSALPSLHVATAENSSTTNCRSGFSPTCNDTLTPSCRAEARPTVFRQNSSSEIKKSGRLDLIGAGLWTFSITLTILLATHATSLCCTGNGTNLLLFTGSALLVILGWSLFFLHERRTQAPILPIALFNKRSFSMAVLSGMLSFTVLFFVLILMPFFLSSILNLSADKIGYVMMSLPLCVFFVAPAAGRLHDAIGARIVASTGLACCCISMLLLTGIAADTSPLTIAAYLALLGFGQAMFLAPNSAAALSSVPRSQTGITSSILATARNMGMLLGTALSGLIFTFFFSRLTGGLDLKDFTPGETAAFLLALQRTFQAGALLAFCALLASWMRGKE